MKKSGLLFLISCFIFLMLTSSAHAAIYYVDWSSPEAGAIGTMNYPFKTINSAEAKAHSGDQIWVKQGVYSLTAPHTGTITLESGVYLRGGYDNGWAQTGNASTTIISGEDSVGCMSGSDLSSATTIEYFTLQNGYNGTDFGGGIYLDSSSPTITNCTFTSSEGGGIWDSTSSPTITNCTFTYTSYGMRNSDASSPTISNCIFSNNYYGGIYNTQSSPTITNCTFTLNNGSGIDNTSSSPTISNCTFTSNSAGSGGGINNYYSSPAISNCTFESNSAYIYGGGICNENAPSPTISNCTFTSNSAGSGGGIFGSYSSAVISNCAFTLNNASNYGGGGVYSYNSTSEIISNCTFESNSAYAYGGGICNLGSSSETISNCVFTSNTCSNDGGGITNFDAPLIIIKNCAFTLNSAVHGGGMANWSSSPTISNCSLTLNAAEAGGGGIFNAGSSPAISNSIIYGNSGGSIYDSSSSPTVTYSCIEKGYQGTGNISSEPLFASGPQGNVYLFPASKCIDSGTGEAFDLGLGSEEGYGTNPDGIHGDSVRVDMGYHYSGYSQAAVVPTIWYVDSSASFPGIGTQLDPFKTINSAEAAVTANNGDEIHVKRGVYSLTAPHTGTITLKSGVYLRGGYDDSWTDQTGISTIDGSSSVRCLYGNGLSSDTIIEYFSIRKGYNGDEGGGLYLTNNSTPTISNCLLESNSAYEGGGMYNDASSPTITNCDFTSNSASHYEGGGICNMHSSPEVLNCTFTSNTSNNVNYGNGGGICDLKNSNPTISNCTFSLNSSYNGGGAIENNSSCSPFISNCTFESNSTYSGDGGGIDNSNGSSPTILNCVFTSNSAYQYGGGISNLSNFPSTPCDPIIKNCTFTSNNAGVGGGIENSAYASPTILNCAFISNVANSYGGGVYNEDVSTSTVSNCTFTLNSSTNGGGIYNYNSSPTILNSIIYGNSGGNITNSSSSPIVTYSCIQQDTVYPGTGNINGDPLIVNAQAGDVHLYNNSPCVNTGTGDAVGLGLGYDNGYGTHPLLIYGDDGRVNMGYHYSGYTNTEQNVPDNTPPAVEVYSPAGGAVWSGGTSHNITWESTDADGFIVKPISIYYSTDEGTTYNVVSAAEDNDGIYPWIVTDVPTTTAKIKMNAVDTYYNLGTGESGVFTISAAAPPSGLILYVDSNVTGPGGGTIGDPFKTINSAEAAATGTEEIHVRQGVYHLNAPGTGTITLKSGVHLMGGYDLSNWDVRTTDASATIISGEGTVRCMSGSGLTSATTVEDLTIKKGYTSGYGAGLSLESSSPTILNCVFTSNQANNYGGGISNYNSSPTINYCTFISNVGAVQGGGGISDYNSFPTINNCAFTSNGASSGGGILNDSSSPAISNCVFTSNLSSFSNNGGGGIYNVSSSPTISNCTFNSNSAHNGGAILNDSSSAPTIESCIIYYQASGGNISNRTSSSSTVTYSCIQGGYTGTGNISGEPQFVGAPANVRLYNYSPCVNGGTGDASALGLGWQQGYGTNQDGIHGDTGIVDMGYHYTGYSQATASPPAQPSNFIGTVESASSILWSWSDVAGEDGYCLNDDSQNLKGLTGADVTASLESGLSANTQYTRHVHAYNNGGDSAPSNSYSKYTLSLSPEVAYQKTRLPYNTASFNFTNEAVFGAGGVQYYKYTWDQIPTESWGGGESTWSSGNITLLATGEGWYLHVKSFNHDGVASGTADYGPYDSYPYWYVDAAASGQGSGTQWDPFRTINLAEAAAASGDEIRVRRGIYYLYQNGYGPGTITLYDGIYLRGGYDNNWNQTGEASTTIISGEGNVPCMYGYDLGSNTTIECFTIQNGYNGYDYGGGLYLSSSSPTILHCVFTLNSSDYGGGGLYLSAASPTILNCVFASNSTSAIGGGIFDDSSSAPIISNCTFTSNSASSGGGIYNSFTSPIILNSIIYGNSGGNIYDDSSSPTVIYSCIEDGYPGTGNISAEPLFVNGPAADVHLLPTSECVNAGTGQASDLNLGWQQGYGTNPDGIHGDTGIVDMGYHYSGYTQNVSTIWYVDAGVAGPGTGTPSDPFKTINSAEAKASSGEAIFVRMGLYHLTSTITLDTGTYLRGGFDGNWSPTGDATTTTISGDAIVQCMYGTGLSSATTIENLTIRNGKGIGAGIYLTNISDPTILNCVFTAFNVYGYSTIYDNSSSPTIARCIFTANSGSGIYNNYSTPENLKLHF